MIKREQDFSNIKLLLKISPIVAILGPRQCGKTTIAKELGADYYFDLENPRDLDKFDNPQLLLENISGLIVIDEIQRKPEFFPLLRYLIDQNKDKQKYLILGSASRELIRQSSESLAGRISYYELGGFRLVDVKHNWQQLWLQGAYPLAFLKSLDDSYSWRDNYIRDFLERDIPMLGINIPANTLRRFWLMLSDYHGQVINYSELARAFGVSDVTVKNYIEILQGAFMVRVLQPWYQNISKRLVKNPKIYIRDSGIYHSLLSIKTNEELFNTVKVGASWEGFAIETVIKNVGKKAEDFFFWRTHSGAELDLFWQDKGKNWGVEVKYSDAPKKTKSMVSAMQDLKIEHLWIVYPGNDTYKIDHNITVLSVSEIGPDFVIALLGVIGMPRRSRV